MDLGVTIRSIAPGVLLLLCFCTDYSLTLECPSTTDLHFLQGLTQKLLSWDFPGGPLVKIL